MASKHTQVALHGMAGKPAAWLPGCVPPAEAKVHAFIPVTSSRQTTLLTRQPGRQAATHLVAITYRCFSCDSNPLCRAVLKAGPGSSQGRPACRM